MEKSEIFEKNWEEFVKHGCNGRPAERSELKEIARTFFEIGFSNGVMS